MLTADLSRALGELHLLPPQKIHPASVATMRNTFKMVRGLIDSARTLADRLPPKVR